MHAPATPVLGMKPGPSPRPKPRVFASEAALRSPGLLDSHQAAGIVGVRALTEGGPTRGNGQDLVDHLIETLWTVDDVAMGCGRDGGRGVMEGERGTSALREAAVRGSLHR